MTMYGQKKKIAPVIGLGEIARLAREYDRISQAYRSGKLTHDQRVEAIRDLLLGPKPQADPTSY